ncbi:MAG: family 43 glycosylhydrolase [Hungatella hathewayi]|nr:family 43 glycosylhydrolase [Hungatella hathewayi]
MKYQALNPYLPLYEYIPDGEPRIFDGRLYLYGSHDEAGAEQFCTNDYVVWSAPVEDLSDWRYEGVSYTYEQTGADLEEAGNLAAPDCVQGMDGRYYLYYNRGARNACEVAVSDRPQGPFQYLGNVRFADGREPESKLFDPGVLVDEDGSIYLYTGFVPTPDSPWIDVTGRYSLAFELEPDMCTIKQGPVELLPGCLASKGTEFENHGFYEASSPRKINGRYYMVYSSEQSHELCFAVSDKPMGGYRYGGVLVSNADIGYQGNREPKAPYGNNHGGLVCIAGQWYIFYHRQTHGIECCRQGCAEPVLLDEYGLFQQVEITSCGLNGGSLSGLGTYNAAYACNLTHDTIGKERLSIRTCVRGQQPHIFEEKVNEDETHFLHYIANMQDGTVAGFKYFRLGEAVRIHVYLSAMSEGTLTVYLDEACSKEAAVIPFTATESWEDFTAEFHGPDGIWPLFFKLSSEGSVDWVSFTLE